MKLNARNPATLVVLAAALVLMTGCQSMGREVETPNLNLVSIKLLSAGLLEQRYGIRLRVQNPNSFRLPVKGMSYELKLAGASFATGVTPEPFSVPGFGETEFDIEVRTNLLNSARHLAEWYSGGGNTLDYELGGKLQVNLPFARAIPFSETGSINLTRP